MSLAAPLLGAGAPANSRQAWLERFARGYFPGRSGQLFLVPREGTFVTDRDPLYTLDEIRNAIHQRFDPQEKTLIQSYDDAGNNQVFVDMARLQTLGLSLTNMAAFLERRTPVWQGR